MGNPPVDHVNFSDSGMESLDRGNLRDHASADRPVSDERLDLIDLQGVNEGIFIRWITHQT